MSTLAAVEVLMEDRWIVVHPHCMSRYDVNDRRPLCSHSTKSIRLLRDLAPPVLILFFFHQYVEQGDVTSFN